MNDRKRPDTFLRRLGLLAGILVIPILLYAAANAGQTALTWALLAAAALCYAFIAWTG